MKSPWGLQVWGSLEVWGRPVSFLRAREGRKLNRVTAGSGGLFSQSLVRCTKKGTLLQQDVRSMRCCKYGREHVHISGCVSVHACTTDICSWAQRPPQLWQVWVLSFISILGYFILGLVRKRDHQLLSVCYGRSTLVTSDSLLSAAWLVGCPPSSCPLGTLPVGWVYY